MRNDPIISVLIWLVLAATALGQSGGQFTVTRSVIAGGGGRASGGNFSVNGTIGQAVASGPTTGGAFSLESGFWAGGVLVADNEAPFDFDGDGKTDLGIYRPAGGEWWWIRSSDGVVPALQFGNSTDVIAPGDFTGDGKLDHAFFRPSDGFWHFLRSEDFSYYAFPFGQ